MNTEMKLDHSFTLFAVNPAAVCCGTNVWRCEHPLTRRSRHVRRRQTCSSDRWLSVIAAFSPAELSPVSFSYLQINPCPPQLLPPAPSAVAKPPPSQALTYFPPPHPPPPLFRIPASAVLQRLTWIPLPLLFIPCRASVCTSSTLKTHYIAFSLRLQEI